MSDIVASPIVQQAEPTPEIKSVENTQVLDEGLDIAGYRSTHDSPFVADYFDIRDYYKSNPEIASMVDEMTQDLIDQTKGESLVFAAKQILDEYKNEMNLNDEDTGLYRLRKVLDLARARRKLRTIDSLRIQAVADIEKNVL